MASEARWGLKQYTYTTVALVGEQQELSPPRTPKKRLVLQVRVQRGGRLLENRAGQALRLAQMEVVGVITDLAMGPPDGSLDIVKFPMRRQAPETPHKAKRGAGREPGKPGWTLRLKRQQATSGADHHIAPLAGILHQGDHLCL